MNLIVPSTVKYCYIIKVKGTIRISRTVNMIQESTSYVIRMQMSRSNMVIFDIDVNSLKQRLTLNGFPSYLLTYPVVPDVLFGTTLPTARMLLLTLGSNFLSSFAYTFLSNTSCTACSMTTQSNCCIPACRIWIALLRRTILKSYVRTRKPRRKGAATAGTSCPVENKRLKTNVVYKATVQHDNKTSQYIGMTENSFKTRYTNPPLNTERKEAIQNYQAWYGP